jgi:hypothetical protein
MMARDIAQTGRISGEEKDEMKIPNIFEALDVETSHVSYIVFYAGGVGEGSGEPVPVITLRISPRKNVFTMEGRLDVALANLVWAALGFIETPNRGAVAISPFGVNWDGGGT